MQPIEKIIKAGRDFTEAKVFEEFEEFDNHLTQLKLTFNQLGKFVCKRKEYLEKSIGQLIKLENEIESTEKQLVKINNFIEERDLDNIQIADYQKLCHEINNRVELMQNFTNRLVKLITAANNVTKKLQQKQEEHNKIEEKPEDEKAEEEDNICEENSGSNETGENEENSENPGDNSGLTANDTLERDGRGSGRSKNPVPESVQEEAKVFHEIIKKLSERNTKCSRELGVMKTQWEVEQAQDQLEALVTIEEVQNFREICHETGIRLDFERAITRVSSSVDYGVLSDDYLLILNTVISDMTRLDKLVSDPNTATTSEKLAQVLKQREEMQATVDQVLDNYPDKLKEIQKNIEQQKRKISNTIIDPEQTPSSIRRGSSFYQDITTISDTAPVEKKLQAVEFRRKTIRFQIRRINQEIDELIQASQLPASPACSVPPSSPPQSPGTNVDFEGMEKFVNVRAHFESLKTASTVEECEAAVENAAWLLVEKDTSATEPLQIHAIVEIYTQLSKELDVSKVKLAATKQQLSVMERLSKEASETEDYVLLSRIADKSEVAIQSLQSNKSILSQELVNILEGYSTIGLKLEEVGQKVLEEEIIAEAEQETGKEEVETAVEIEKSVETDYLFSETETIKKVHTKTVEVVCDTQESVDVEPEIVEIEPENVEIEPENVEIEVETVDIIAETIKIEPEYVAEKIEATIDVEDAVHTDYLFSQTTECKKKLFFRFYSPTPFPSLYFLYLCSHKNPRTRNHQRTRGQRHRNRKIN